MRLTKSTIFFSFFRILFSAGVLLFFFSGSFAQTVWVSEYNKEGIEIFTRNPEGSYLKEFKAQTRMKTDIHTLMAVMADHHAHIQWMDGIATCELIEVFSSREKIYYYTIPFPWPMTDRDLVLRTTVQQNPVTRGIEIKIISEPGAVTDRGNERMRIAQGSWEFLPLPEGMVKVSYQFFSDPTGIPAWIVNMFILNTPVNTFKSLKEMILKPEYQRQKFDWIN